jgi:hypothetical protein
MKFSFEFRGKHTSKDRAENGMDYTPYRACCYCVKIKDIKNREPPALCIPVFGPLIAFIPSPERSHFAANRPDWEHLGKQEAFLGYDLTE